MTDQSGKKGSQHQPILSMRLVNYLSWEKAEIKRFQAERFVFTVQVENQRYKIFQVFFGKSDGSLYVTFPYFDIDEGIVSIGTIPAMLKTAEINLELQGKVTSKKVKYAHHPDGEVHFSQTGQVSTSIRRKSLPLETAEGHLFSLQVQGLSHFEADPTQQDHLPKMKRTVLDFNFGNKKPEAIKIVARWYKAASLISRSSGHFFGPKVQGQTPDGRITSAFLIGTPKGWPMEHYALLVSCEAIDKLTKENEAALVFTGGFDTSSKFGDIAQAASFLCVMYPTTNYEELSQRIGTIDIISSNR